MLIPTQFDASRLFVIYLNDHRALLVGERALAGRCATANADSDLGRLLKVVVDQIDTDLFVVDCLVTRDGGRRNLLKTLAAVVGERFAQLKMNGQLSGHSALSRVREIEALQAGASTRRAMWNAAAALDIDDDAAIDAALRAAAADEQHNCLGEHHAEAVLTAFETMR